MNELIKWINIKSQLKHLNNELFDIINALPLTAQHKLIRCRYRFGDSVVTNGRFTLLDDDVFNSLLDYSPIPLFMPIRNHLEVFVFNNERVIPLNLIEEGRIVGSFEATDRFFNSLSQSKWSITSGARSLFMLPKITDKTRYQRMGAKYQIPSDLRVKHLQDHWHLFKYLAQHKNFPGPAWQSEIVVFTKAWFSEQNRHVKAWRRFYDYIFEDAWRAAKFVLTKCNCTPLFPINFAC